MDDVPGGAAIDNSDGARAGETDVRALLFVLSGLSMLVSVALIAIDRFMPVTLGPAWFAIPAIAAQILAIAGLISLRSMAARGSLLLARLGAVAASTAGVLMLSAAAWLAASPGGSVPGELGAGFQLLILAFVLSIICAFIGNAGAISRKEGWGSRLVLLMLAPPLLWIGLMLVAMAIGLQAALALDLYTNGLAGLALFGTGLILRRRAA